MDCALLNIGMIFLISTRSPIDNIFRSLDGYIEEYSCNLYLLEIFEYLDTLFVCWPTMGKMTIIWRRRNKDKLAAYRRSYYQKNKKKTNAYKMEYIRKNREVLCIPKKMALRKQREG